MTITEGTGAAATSSADRAEQTAPARGARLTTVFAAVFAVGGLAIGIRPLHDNSFMWHLRTGRLILDHGIPRADPYSFSAPGVQWVAQSWLAELTYGVVHEIGGAFGLRLLGAVLGFVVGLMLFRLAWHGSNDRMRAGGLTVLTIAVLMNVWSERPLMFGIVAMLVLVTIVEMPHTWVGRHPLVSLPILMWFWANSHGTFAIGFGYLALHLIGRALEGHPLNNGPERRLLQGGLIAAAATMLNPYGIDLVLFPLRLMARGQVLRDVAEWQSPDFRELGGMLFGAFLLCTLVIFARKRPGTRDLLITVAFVILGLWAIRNVGLTAIAIMPILARLVRNEHPREDLRRSFHTLMLGAAVFVAFAAVLNGAGERNWSLKKYPVEAFDAIKDQQLAGKRLFTTDAWGGYLIMTEWPEQKVFFDDRYDTYPLEINEDYGKISNVAPGWHETLDRHGIEVVMSPASSGLVQALAEREDWVRVHVDKVAVVYARRTLVNS